MSGMQLREVFGFGYTVGIQREEDACFLFSQVQSFKNGIAYPFRSECADMESEGNYRFKVVNLHTAIIGYPYASPYPIIPKTSALAKRLQSCTECRGGYSEQVAKFPFAHGGCANVGRHDDVAVTVCCYDASFHGYAWLWGYTSERCVQLVAEHRQVIVKFLRGYLGIDLRGDNIRMFQNMAYSFYRHPLAKGVVPAF